MAIVTEYAMSKVVRAIADPENKATAMTVKLFADCGVTVFTPAKVEETAYTLYKSLSAWFMARESAGQNEESPENKAVIDAYAKAARKAAHDWFVMFGSKPAKKDGDPARAFVALNYAEMGILGEIRERAQHSVKDVNDTAKLSKKFLEYLTLETARLLDGKPYIRLGEDELSATKKAANADKATKSAKTRADNADKKQKQQEQEQAQQLATAQQAQADAEKKFADAAALITEAITLVEQSHATDIEKASIIGRLKAAIGQ